MFCRNCGKILDQQAQFCGSCGVPVFSGASGVRTTMAAKDRRPLYIAVAAGLLFLGLCIVGLTDSTTSSRSDSTPSTSTSTTSTPPTEARHQKLGEDVFAGYWAYRGISAHWQKSIGSEYTAQYPDAKFLVVDLAIRNNDKTASTLPPVKLVDGEGREYDESSKGIFLEKSFGLLKSVNPGVTSRGYVIFDVPTGSYALKVSGGYTSGASAIIDLQ